MWHWRAIGVALFLLADQASAAAGRSREFPKTDFSIHSVPLSEIISGGPPRDGIPAIDRPEFVPVRLAGIPKTEPVISIEINGMARAYPFRVLIWHEIVNDVIDGVPIAVTYCPLCNAAVVFSRRVEGRVLDFGTTGRLRNSDLVMYDRQTESWWQQYTGEAIVGALTGMTLERLPARIESLALFRARFSAGEVLVAPKNRFRNYGGSPYPRYDSLKRPFLYSGRPPPGIAPLARVVSIGDRAWSLELLRRKKRIEAGDLVLTWRPGQNSALDEALIEQGRDVGNVVVRRRDGGRLVDVAYGVDFAFAFHAFYPDAEIVTE